MKYSMNNEIQRDIHPTIPPEKIDRNVFQKRRFPIGTFSSEMRSFGDFVSVLFLFLMLRIALVWSALICLNLLKLVQITCSFIFDCFLGVAIPCMSRILECFPNFNEYFELFCVLLPWPALFWFFYFLLKY